MYPVMPPTPIRLEFVIARTMSELRAKRGWTQSDLAWRMKQQGLTWNTNRVTQIETLRRPLSLLEITALAWVFEVPLADLAPGDDLIELPHGTVPLAQVRAAWTGDNSAQQRGRAVRQARRDQIEELRKIAKSLDIEPQVLDWLAVELYGRDFSEERDARVGDVSGLTKRSAQTKRGHAARKLITEISAHLEKEGREEVKAAYRRARYEQHKDLVARLLPGDRGEDD